MGRLRRQAKIIVSDEIILNLFRDLISLAQFYTLGLKRI